MSDVIREKETLELERARLALAREKNVAAPTTSDSSAPQERKFEELQATVDDVSNRMDRIESKMDKILSGKFDLCAGNFFLLLIDYASYTRLTRCFATFSREFAVPEHESNFSDSC